VLCDKVETSLNQAFISVLASRIRTTSRERIVYAILISGIHVSPIKAETLRD